MPRFLFITQTVVVLSLTLATSMAFGQAGKGTIQGRVTDSTGAVLPGATIIVTPGGFRAVTDKEGGYAIAGLTPGDYTVAVSFVGLKDDSTTAHVSVGQAVRLDLRLDVPSQSEMILVGKPPAISQTRF